MSVITVTEKPYERAIFGRPGAVEPPSESVGCFRMPGYPDRFNLLFSNEPQRLVEGGPIEPAAPRVAAIGMCTVISDPPTPYQRPVSVNKGDVFLFHGRLWMLVQNWCGTPRCGTSGRWPTRRPPTPRRPFGWDPLRGPG